MQKGVEFVWDSVYLKLFSKDESSNKGPINVNSIYSQTREDIF
jgi:hypothetical protein